MLEEFAELEEMGDDLEESILLYRDNHEAYLMNGLDSLPGGYACLDASRPWLCYWIVHALDLLGRFDNKPKELKDDVANFLGKCQDPEGGFAGGPMQLPHLAPTYAAVNALVSIGTQEAYDIIDRPALHRFLLSRKSPDGGFTMHDGGEVDVRGSYCALSAASVVGILTPELLEGCADFLIRCQSYEGGFSAAPGNEAHGGYTFCGMAACMLVGCEERLDLPRLLGWITARQLQYECGFNGRTNKVVDSCYSFWQGGVFPLVQQLSRKEPPSYDPAQPTVQGGTWLFDQVALQRYVLCAAQLPNGGFRDKPGKGKDHYHTCYSLSGLSVAQHSANSGTPCSLGVDTLLRRTDGIHNCCVDKVEQAYAHFAKCPPVN